MESTTASGKVSEQCHVVCRRDELEPGEILGVTVGRRRLAVACIEEGVYRAMSDTCPHEGASLSKGKVERSWISDEIGRYLRSEHAVVVCPWHNFEFDVETGCAYAPQRLRVKTYRIEVRGEDVVVYV